MEFISSNDSPQGEGIFNFKKNRNKFENDNKLGNFWDPSDELTLILFLQTMRLTKRIDEVRLLESRKSARLADQDTDFARLADMAGDRKRASSHSIDVPHVIG